MIGGPPSLVLGNSWEWATTNAAFSNPPAAFRLIQFSGHDGATLPVSQMAAAGIGGVQLYMQTNGYLQTAEAWANVSNNITALKAAGMQVWMTDENGYPSGMAGGRVVEANPAHESRCLIQVATNGTGQVPFSLSLPADAEKFVYAYLYPSVNGSPTLASGVAIPVQTNGVVGTGLSGNWTLRAFALQLNQSNNQATSTAGQFAHPGTYPNFLDAAAADSFVSRTHEEYAQRFGPLAGKIDAFYSNEPNLMTLWWSNDPTARPGGVAFLPWSEGLPARFQQDHGYALLSRLPALYGGTDTDSKMVRRHFYKTVANIYTENFSQRIANWADQNGVLSAGHPLQEEDLYYHVIHYGDLFRFVEPMQVPACDLPMPDRGAAWNYWMPKFFSSIGQFKNRTTVAALLDPIVYRPQMNLTPLPEDFRRIVNMAAFSGVNQFQTYLFWHLYDPSIYRGMSEYVGRLSLVLRGASPAATVGMYYPIETFQANYLPSAGYWPSTNATPEWQTLRTWQNTLNNTAQNLAKAGIDFNWVHGNWLTNAVVEGGQLVVGGHRYSAMVLPRTEVLPLPVASKLQQFMQAGGKIVLVNRKPVLGDSSSEHAAVAAIFNGLSTVTAGQVVGQLGTVSPPGFAVRVSPPPQTGSTQEFFSARFLRDGRRITYLANNGSVSVTPTLTLASGGTLSAAVYNPLDGSVTSRQLPGTLTLAPSSSLLLVENPAAVPAQAYPEPPPLAVVNGSFSDRTGMTNTSSQWSGGFPVGWSGGTNSDFAVVNLSGTAYANLGELTPGGESNAITQTVGTNQATVDLRLHFTLTNLYSNSFSTVGVALKESGGAVLSTTNVNGAGSFFLTAKGLAPGVAIQIAFWGTSASSPMGLTGVGMETFPIAGAFRWNGGQAGVWTHGGSGWVDLSDNTAALWNRPTPPLALFTNAAAGTNVTVASNGVTIGNLEFAGGNYQLSGGSLNLESPVWTLAGDAIATVTSPLAGSVGLQKQGEGKLTLAGNSTFSGPTSIQSGTLALTGSLASTNDLVVAEGAVLEARVGSPGTLAGNVIFEAGSRIRVDGTPTAAAVPLLTVGGTISGNPLLDPPVAGYTLRTTENLIWLRATSLSLANGNFGDLAGLGAGANSQWKDGVPMGWSTESSTNRTSPTYSVHIGADGTASVANLAQLGPAAPFQPLYQTLGTAGMVGTLTVNFQIRNDWTPGSAIGVGAAIYQVGTGSVGSWPTLATATITATGTHTLQAQVAPETSVAIGFWNFGAANAGLDNVTLSYVPDPPSGLTYSPGSVVATVGSAISPWGPPTLTGTATSFSILPLLPAGLSIDSATGVISGTPGFPNPSTVHTVTASNPSGSTSTTVTLTVRSIFQNWAANFGLDPATNGASGADPDGDSFSNALEYAFGTSPVAGGGELVKTATVADEFTVQWLQRTDGSTSYIVQETSSLLSAWSTSPAVVQAGSGSTPPSGYEWKKITVPTTDRKFYRINASF